MVISNAGFVRFFTNAFALEAALNRLNISETTFDSRLNAFNRWESLQYPSENTVHLDNADYLPVLSIANLGSLTLWRSDLIKGNQDEFADRLQQHTVPVGASLIVDEGVLYEDSQSYCGSKLQWNQTRRDSAIANQTTVAPPHTVSGWCTRVLLDIPVGLQPRLLSPHAPQSAAPVVYLRGISEKQAAGDLSEWWRYRPDGIVISNETSITHTLLIPPGTNTLLTANAKQVPPATFCEDMVNGLQKTVAMLLGLPANFTRPGTHITAQDIAEHQILPTHFLNTNKTTQNSLDYTQIQQFFKGGAPEFCQNIGLGMVGATKQQKPTKNIGKIVLPSVLTPLAAAGLCILVYVLRRSRTSYQGRMLGNHEMAYALDTNTEARHIRQNIQWALRKSQTPMIRLDVVKSAIDSVAKQSLTLSAQHKNRLCNMLHSNCNSELQLVWTYLKNGSQGEGSDILQRQFVEHLAKTEGCLEGRANQVLQFFLGGIDPAILRSPLAPPRIKQVPDNNHHKNQLMGSMVAALSEAQRYQHLSLDATRTEEANFLRKIFVAGKPYEQYMTDVRMTKAVFKSLFQEMQQGIEMQAV